MPPCASCSTTCKCGNLHSGLYMYELHCLCSTLFAGALDAALVGWLPRLVFGLFSLDILTLSGGGMCYGRANAMTRIWVSVMTPVITYAIMTVLLMLRLCISRCCSANRHDAQQRARTVAEYRRTALYLLIGSYAATLDVAFQVVFGCTDAGLNGLQVLKAYPSVSCASGAYKTTRVFMSIIGLALGVGIPASLFFALRRRLWKQTLFTLEAHQKIGILTEVYRPRWDFWEAVVLMRRTLLLVIVFVNVDYGNLGQMMFLFGGVTTVFLLLQLFLWPYRRLSDNALELFVLFSHLLVTLALATARHPMSHGQSNIFAMWTLLSSSLLLLCVLIVKSLGWRRHRAERAYMYLANGEIDIRPVRAMYLGSEPSRLRKIVAPVVECLTCAPLTRLKFGANDKRLDQVLIKCLVAPSDFGVFRRGGGSPDGQQTREIYMQAAKHMAAQCSFLGLRTLAFDMFDIERNAQKKATADTFQKFEVEPNLQVIDELEEVAEEEDTEMQQVAMARIVTTDLGMSNLNLELRLHDFDDDDVDEEDRDGNKGVVCTTAGALEEPLTPLITDFELHWGSVLQHRKQMYYCNLSETCCASSAIKLEAQEKH
ncbi:MAG: hypothetical protein MHM6MM_008700 [Cercozoa sp. M6MM]